MELSECLCVKHLGEVPGKRLDGQHRKKKIWRYLMFFHFSTQVDSINSLLRRPVMVKACEETKHFYSEYGHLGNLFIGTSVCVCKFDEILTLFFLNGDRISPNRRLDSSLPLRYSQEYPGGPMEPAYLYQNPGGEPPEICRRYVHRHEPRAKE